MSHDTTLTEIEADGSAEGEPSDGGQAGEEVASYGAGPAPGPSGDDDAWTWATEHGDPERASTEQLVSWLARGELPPHTLVWKPGWGEWLPAMQVVELAAAFPRVTRGSRRRSRLDDDAETPPPVPVAHYPRLRLLAKDVLAESPLPPATAVAQGVAPAQAGRRVLRDLDHVQQDVVTSQVPAAAMLEAALAMKRLGTAVTPNRAERWARLDLGTFGEGPLQASTSSPPTLSPHALALDVPALPEPRASETSRRRSSGYGPWLLFGALVGAALGLLSVYSPEAATAIAALRPPLPPPAENTPPAPPPGAIDTTPRAASVAEEIPRVAPPVAQRPAGIVERKRKGEPALLSALRISKNDGFDRVVFEFRERLPGYRLEYLDKPVRDCGSGAVRRIEGDGRLEVRFSPASGHTEGGEPTVRARELKPALSMIREIERTCDFEGVVTWVVGTASAQRFRAFELSGPPRLVLDIDH